MTELTIVKLSALGGEEEERKLPEMLVRIPINAEPAQGDVDKSLWFSRMYSILSRNVNMRLIAIIRICPSKSYQSLQNKTETDDDNQPGIQMRILYMNFLMPLIETNLWSAQVIIFRTPNFWLRELSLQIQVYVLAIGQDDQEQWIPCIIYRLGDHIPPPLFNQPVSWKRDTLFKGNNLRIVVCIWNEIELDLGKLFVLVSQSFLQPFLRVIP